MGCMISILTAIRSKALAFTLAALFGVSLITAVSAQQTDNNTIENQQRSFTFNCEPGSIPETSLLEGAREDIRKVFNPNYSDKYPDQCKAWSKTYIVEKSDGETVKYSVNVVKYQGGDQIALITVARGFEGLAFADVKLNGESVGSTNSDGRLRTKMSDDFKLVITTANTELELYG